MLKCVRFTETACLRQQHTDPSLLNRHTLVVLVNADLVSSFSIHSVYTFKLSWWPAVCWHDRLTIENRVTVCVCGRGAQ